MEKDLANIYESELYKTKKIITKLKSSGLNTTKYEEVIEKINTELENNNIDDLANCYRGGTVFQKDYLTQNYQNAINKIKLIQNNLIKYEVYIKVNALIELLKISILNKKIEKNELNTIKTQLIDLLNEIKNTTTLDYTFTKDLTENLYQVSYYLIKEEIKLGNNQLLDFFTKNEQHSIYLDKIISKELENINLNNEENIKILKRKQELDSKGFNSSYVDYELLYSIINATDKEEIQDNIKNILNVLSDINSQIISSFENNHNNTQAIKKYKGLIKDCSKPSFYVSKIMSILLSFTLIGSAYVGGNRLAKKLNSKDVYLTTITTQNTKTNKTEIESQFYSDDYSDKVIITKYSPYKKNLTGFSREVTTYILKDTSITSLEDIDLLDFKNLDMDSKTEKEEKKSLSNEDFYNEDYYIIKTIKVDKNNKEQITDENNKYYDYITIPITSSILAFLLVIKIIVNSIKEITEKLDTLKYLKERYNEIILDEEKELKKLREILIKYESEIKSAINYANMIKDTDIETYNTINNYLDTINKGISYVNNNKTKIKKLD